MAEEFGQSIIIAHRNRQRHLALCLESLERSRAVCPGAAFEVVVVDNGSQSLSSVADMLPLWARLIPDNRSMTVFSKSALNNVGIRTARFPILTFLDADSIVGPRFLEGIKALTPTGPVRCCYRVRYLPLPLCVQIQKNDGDATFWGGMFAEFNAKVPGENGTTFDRYQLGYEAYGSHDRNIPNGEPWGNSQFSIRRSDLGDLRFDEEYRGHGAEDLDLNMQIEAKFGPRYKGWLWADGEHAIFQQVHAPSDWRRVEFAEPNGQRYLRKRKELLGR